MCHISDLFHNRQDDTVIEKDCPEALYCVTKNLMHAVHTEDKEAETIAELQMIWL